MLYLVNSVSILLGFPGLGLHFENLQTFRKDTLRVLTVVKNRSGTDKRRSVITPYSRALLYGVSLLRLPFTICLYHRKRSKLLGNEFCYLTGGLLTLNRRLHTARTW